MPETNEQPAPKPRDFRQEVTDNIVALLEKGVAPWQKPWDAQSRLEMPVNPTTDRAYRGGNAIHLLALGLQREYQYPRWMTYKQASERGWQVRRGEKGTQIEFWDVKPQQERQTSPTRVAEPTPPANQERPLNSTGRLIHRVYTVFNAQQIDGVPPLVPKEYKPMEIVEAGERILKNSGAKITHDQADRAFYSRTKDEIHLPPQQAFKDAPGYYGTALHELGHWTGHPSRLNRWTQSEHYRFGDTHYAKEELRAELASVFIAAEKGIPHDPQNHAAYVGSWIQALKQDKNEIFRAANDASKAADLILSLEREVSIADQELDTEAPALSTTFSEIAELERDHDALQEGTRREQKTDRQQDEPLRTEAATARESPELTARHVPQNGAISVIDKQNGTEKRTQIQKQELVAEEVNARPAAQVNPGSDRFEEASTLAAKLLGESAKTKPAQLGAGVYRGPIIGETSELLLQRVSAQFVVAHDRRLFDPAPQLGSNIAVTYSNGSPAVREIKHRARAMEMSR